MEGIHTAKYVFRPVLTDFYNFINAEIEKCSWLDQYVLEIKSIENSRLSISHCSWIEISHSLSDGILNLSITCYRVPFKMSLTDTISEIDLTDIKEVHLTISKLSIDESTFKNSLPGGRFKGIVKEMVLDSKELTSSLYGKLSKALELARRDKQVSFDLESIDLQNLDDRQFENICMRHFTEMSIVLCETKEHSFSIYNSFFSEGGYMFATCSVCKKEIKICRKEDAFHPGPPLLPKYEDAEEYLDDHELFVKWYEARQLQYAKWLAWYRRIKIVANPSTVSTELFVPGFVSRKSLRKFLEEANQFPLFVHNLCLKGSWIKQLFDFRKEIDEDDCFVNVYCSYGVIGDIGGGGDFHNIFHFHRVGKEYSPDWIFRKIKLMNWKPQRDNYVFVFDKEVDPVWKEKLSKNKSVFFITFEQMEKEMYRFI